MDFVGGLLAAVKLEYGVALTIDDITQWDMSAVLNPIIGRSWWKWMRDREWLWANFPAMEGAIGGLERLRETYYIEIITSKPEWARHNVWKWLGKWRPPVDRVTIVGIEDRKVDFTDAILLVDDKPQNVLEFLNEGRMGVLFGRPHNEDAYMEMDRVEGWGQLLSYLLLLEKGPIRIAAEQQT